MDSLIQKIRAAFSYVSPLKDEELLHPECMDDTDILEFYGGVKWEDMSYQNVVYSYAAPSAFSARAFQYYLPAYLIWSLSNQDTVEVVIESILMSLNPGTDREHLHDFRKSKFALLDDDQLNVVHEFLHHFSEDEEYANLAEQALVNYWNTSN